ncbi:hypothetical protein GPECTOR_3g102 [Gonium pectorale]|uniref:DNA repair metallo-beta-lactamase domain-containing protein n=1 Tax=Gonium pectorale TaxID=33097 RepID=A0A150GYY8_GONPE|nr:hypothetical protein GPECTOR_3g102 [Gonium pectorale]|eukprot:KXZ54932.1 hypothetical protein GPECTOR_3g102 [Gonium pectorale]
MAATVRPSTVLECLPFVVDTWTERISATGKPHFLTHCHKDHTEGIEHCAVDVYCTDLTRRLLLIRQPDAARANRFHALEPGACVEVAHRGVTFTVTALDANHCPGSAMFLFQGLSHDTVRAVQEALGDGGCGCECGYGRGGGSQIAVDGDGCGSAATDGACCCGAEAGGERLDLLYLDCTFADLPLDFPTREGALRHAETLIRGAWGPAGAGVAAGPGAAGGAQPRPRPRPRRVYLSADLLGTEPLLALAGGAFGQPLYVPPPERHKEYGFANADLVRQRREELALLLPGQALTNDASAPFHLCGIRDFAHRGGPRGQQQKQQQRRAASWGLMVEEDAMQLGSGGYDAATASGSGGGAVGSGGTDCLYIRASTQVFAQSIREQYERQSQLLAERSCAPPPAAAVQERAVHYVLYSAHSSRSELVAALEALRPRAARPIAGDQVGHVAAVVAERMGAERLVEVEAEMALRMAWADESQPDGDGGGWERACPVPSSLLAALDSPSQAKQSLNGCPTSAAAATAGTAPAGRATAVLPFRFLASLLGGMSSDDD